MLFSNRRYGCKNIPLSINMNDQSIKEVSSFKYLGLNLDRHLNFELHANKVASK